MGQWLDNWKQATLALPIEQSEPCPDFSSSLSRYVLNLNIVWTGSWWSKPATWRLPKPGHVSVRVDKLNGRMSTGNFSPNEWKPHTGIQYNLRVPAESNLNTSRSSGRSFGPNLKCELDSKLSSGRAPGPGLSPGGRRRPGRRGAQG